MSNIENLIVTCSKSAFRVGGTLVGLAAGEKLILLNNNADPIDIESDGEFVFPIPVAAQGSYSVTVKQNPAAQVCTVGDGIGWSVAADVMSIRVTCSSATFTLQGRLFGLSSGRQVVLLMNESYPLVLSANGVFTIPQKIASRSSYSIRVATQPIGQTCTITNNWQPYIVSDMDNIFVNCAGVAHTVGGELNGLLLGEQLTLTNNGADPLTLKQNGSFLFPGGIAYGASFSVKIASQPTGQTCTVNNGTGDNLVSDYNGVSIICSVDAYSVYGTLSGLAEGQQVTLLNNASDPVTLRSNGSFVLPKPVAYRATYSVTVATQPYGQRCTVSNATGVGTGNNNLPILVACSEVQYKVSGNLEGLAEGQRVTLTLASTATESLQLDKNGAFVFGTSVPFMENFIVTVASQPAGQICTAANGLGSGVVADVSDIRIICATYSVSVSGKIEGLISGAGKEVKINNNKSNLITLKVNKSFTFPNPVARNAGYLVTVDFNTTGQVCSVANGYGAGVVKNIDDIIIKCSAKGLTVGGTVTGLVSGQQVTLWNNFGDPLVINKNGDFIFNKPIAFGNSYIVVVATQPIDQTCSVTGGESASSSSDVRDVAVLCSANALSIGGNVTGLADGQQVTLINNSGDPITIFGNGPFKFSDKISYQGSYAIKIGAQPLGQTCKAINEARINVTEDVTDIQIICQSNMYKLLIYLGALADDSVTLTNNGSDTVTLHTEGVYEFAQLMPFGSTYQVTIDAQPARSNASSSRTPPE